MPQMGIICGHFVLTPSSRQTITWGCVGFRMYTRFFIMYSPGWDDFFVMLVLVSWSAPLFPAPSASVTGLPKQSGDADVDDHSSLARWGPYANVLVSCGPGYMAWAWTNDGGFLLATQHGMGEHFLNLSDEDRITYLRVSHWRYHVSNSTDTKSPLQYFYISNSTYCMSTAFVKLALLFQYLRIFKEGRMRAITIVVMIVTALWGAAYTFMAIVPCFPIHKYWVLTIPGKCYGFGSLDASVFYGMYASSAAMNMTLDLIVLAIPVPVYFSRDTPFKSKLGLTALFCMGIM